MKIKKGFTLVEMLGVLILLVIIFTIMFPALTKIIKTTNDDINEATNAIIESAVTDFLSEKNDIYPINDNYTYCITLEQLVDNANLTEKQISSLKDKDMMVETTFINDKPIYEIIKTCAPVSVDIEFALVGSNNMSFEVGIGGQYIEPGAVAKNKAGDAVSYTVTITNFDKETVAYIDTTKIDTYAVKYTATIDGEQYSIERTVKVVDTTDPVITVNPSSVTLAITNNTYDVMTGITASDNSGENPKISASTNLSLGQAGTYLVTYTAEDSSGNIKTAKRTIIVSNATLVSISIGSNTVNHQINSGAYIDSGATAQDLDGNNLTSEIITTIRKNSSIVSTVEVNKVATYFITFSIIKDKVTYSETRTVNIIDTINPVITGATETTINTSVATFNLLSGITVTDNSGESITATTSGTLSLGIIGSYYITYTATDSSSNIATVVRRINIIDDVLPTVVFGTNGNSTYAKSRSTSVTASDNYSLNTSSLKYLWNTTTTAPADATITTSFTNGGTITTPAGVTGGYYLWILAKDSSGNTSILRSNVFNLDNIVPVITLNGTTPVSVNGGSVYTDAGATATDNTGGTITGSIVPTSTVNTSILGAYTVTYNVSDVAGNTASRVRTVNVVDNNNPIVTANSASYTVTQGNSIALPGTYFTISQNGLATISSTVCIDTSNSNVTVTNVSSLTAGTHIIRCTSTKTNGLSAYASTTLTVNTSAYTLGQALVYSGINWHVIKISGANVTLLADYTTITTKKRFDTTYNATYPSCTYSPTGYCGNNVWASSEMKTYLNTTWLTSTTLSTSNLVDEGYGFVRLISFAEYNTLKTAVGAQAWLYSSTVGWWWTMTSSGTYKLYAVTDTGTVSSMMEAFDLAYARPVITLK